MSRLESQAAGSVRAEHFVGGTAAAFPAGRKPIET